MIVLCPFVRLHVITFRQLHCTSMKRNSLSLGDKSLSMELCYIYTYTDRHTDMTRTRVHIMFLSTGSCLYHIRVMSTTIFRAKFVPVDYFETVKIVDTDKFPYRIHIASMSCLSCITGNIRCSIGKFEIWCVKYWITQYIKHLICEYLSMSPT